MPTTNESTTSKALSISKFRLPITLALSLHILVLIRTGWVHEDAFITFRVIRNFLDGFGPVWNVGERVQAFTHPLWMFFLSSFIGITNEYYYTVIFVSIFLAVITLLLLVFRHAASLPTALLLILILSFSKAYIDYSTSGLENVLTHLLLVLFYLVYFKKQQTSRTLCIAALIAAFGILNRMDVGVIYLPALLYLWYRVGLWRGIIPLSIGFFPLLLWEIFSIVYYGFPFPNTAYAKLKTGIDGIVYLQKGLLYLLHSIGPDPITGAIIGIGLVMALRNKEWQARWLGVGILLYLLYTVRIGGDYMVGRFLTAPFIVSIVYLARYTILSAYRTPFASVLLLVILLGIMSPKHSPIFSGEDYNAREENVEGIADERSWYYSVLGLLTTNRSNRMVEMGYMQGYIKPQNLAAGGIGRFGFQASSYTYIVDWVGLADPLLARLPARYHPEWRMGHPIRIVPDGYLVTRRTGKNMLGDPALSAYYDKLQFIIRGDLWRWERFREIWRFNLGDYEHLIDLEFYRYNQRVELNLAEITRDVSDTIISFPEAVSFKQHGVLINFDQVRHNPLLMLGTNLEQFTLIYKLGETPVHDPENGTPIGTQATYEQTVRAVPIQFGEDIYQVVSVPKVVTKAGYNTIHLRPDYTDEFTLTYFDLLERPAGKSQLHPTQLAELYFYQYYRAQRVARNEWLPLLFAEMEKVDQAMWSQVDRTKMLDLLLIPDPTINEFALMRLPNNTVLTDDEGIPVLRYLGATRILADDDGDMGEEIRLNLTFEVLSRLKEEYSFWFNMTPAREDPSLIIYDYFPQVPTTEWVPGTLQHLEAILLVEPDTYSMSFGLWTRERRRLYEDVEQDIHWTDLGSFTLEEIEIEE